MKRTQLLLLITMTALFGCASSKFIPSDAAHDEAFVGTWIGEDIDELANLKRNWTQIRKANGTYKITMISEQDGLTDETTEQGYWWIKDDKFYEINPKIMFEPDIYQFEILTPNEIKFTNVSFDITADVYRENYSFIDRRK